MESWKTHGKLAYPGLNHLNAYVTARLYRDTDQDVDQMLNDYYDRFFAYVFCVFHLTDYRLPPRADPPQAENRYSLGVPMGRQCLIFKFVLILGY